VSNSPLILVRRGNPVPEGIQPGAAHRRFTDGAGNWAGWSGWIENAPGDISAWHQHPKSDTYVYIVQGSITIECGLTDTERVVASAGELVMIPAQTVHREITSPDSPLHAFVIRVGQEPESVNVDEAQSPPT
jgi:mannose-6-phosphate isomerase-like protein (cupin superfamily)